METNGNMSSKYRFTNKVDSAVDENEVCIAGGKSSLISFIFLSLMVEQNSFISMVEIRT